MPECTVDYTETRFMEFAIMEWAFNIVSLVLDLPLSQWKFQNQSHGQLTEKFSLTAFKDRSE